MGSIGITVAANGIDFKDGYYPGHIACIDRAVTERGLKYGISEYWTAKPVTMLSRSGVKVVSVHRNLAEYHWINSSAWFQPAYDFALVNSAGPDAARVRSINGEPSFTEQCGGITVLGYERGGLVTSKAEP